ncbi:MAG: UDP-glucose dehydrogenase family protein [Candidatus Micrarchaeaceae archaeon]
MRIGVVGLGYVGIVTAAVLAERGNEIIGVDVDGNKVGMLEKGTAPIHEPGLGELISRNSNRNRFSTDYGVLKDAEIIFISVPTPTSNGNADMSYVMSAVRSASNANGNAIIIVKSTTLPGTAAKIRSELGIEVVTNPEFISEGTAVRDTEKPDRIIIGSRSRKAADAVESIWSFTGAETVVTSNENAELIKYASNTFLATKISFVNELANLCEKLPNTDIDVISRGMGLDKRISPYFLKAGMGFGGSCFPKDTRALASFARSVGETTSIVEAAIEVNRKRIDRVVGHIKDSCGNGIGSARIGVLGLAFKKDTDDIRESQAINLIGRLKAQAGSIYAYDPVVKHGIDGVNMCATKEECIEKSDVVVIATDWDEFKDIAVDESKTVIDCKRILDPNRYKRFKGVGIGTGDK